MISKDLIVKFKKCSTKEEALDLAKKEGINVNQEIIEKYFVDSNRKELLDEELDNVAGGGCGVYIDTYDGKSRPIKYITGYCELYERAAAFMAVNQINQCSNCKYFSANVDGRVISENAAWCTNDNRIEDVDYID